jgi:hypothetical protein
MVMERTNSECINRSFSVRLSVEMGDKAKPLLKMVHARLGGTLQIRASNNPKHQGRVVWNMHTKNALPVLKALYPHMIVKQEQCRLAIAACRLLADKPLGFGRTVGVIKELISELNRTGQTTPIPGGWFARIVGGVWITPQGNLCEQAGLEPFNGPWPQSGMMRSGVAFPLPQSAHLTCASGSGSWHTPVARDFKGYTKRERESICNQLRALYGGSGRPNPKWLEWLMGFPEGWSEIP